MMRFKDGVITEILRYKDGVAITYRMNAKITNAIVVADNISIALTGIEVTVTAVFDGKHMKGSLHYTGNAVDLRTRNYTNDQKKQVIEVLKEELGKDYDIIDEVNHIHLEWDPK